jgi:hypothetical protein
MADAHLLRLTQHLNKRVNGDLRMDPCVVQSQEVRK